MPRPLHDNVWLLFPEDTYLDDGVMVKTETGSRLDATVVAAGAEVPPETLGVGDRVLASMYDGMPVEYEGCLFRSVPYGSVLARFG